MAILIVLLHVLAVGGLIRAFAPDFSAAVVQEVRQVLTVTITTPPPPPPPPAAPDPAGDAGAIGKRAVPKAAKAPEPRIAISEKPAPAASSTGAANTSGAGETGQGTGAGGSGSGTGAGGSGSGQGGGVAVRPSVRSGNLDKASDFPVPEGGRSARFGKSVTVYFTVTTEGRARDCSVARSDVDAETTARVCPLVIRKIRFNPATSRDGTPVEARYGYRVDFNER